MATTERVSRISVEDVTLLFWEMSEGVTQRVVQRNKLKGKREEFICANGNETVMSDARLAFASLS
jgi:hypothetical protein